MNPLRKWRNAQGWTAAHVASELGVTERTVLAYESGAFSPSDTRLGSICALMDVDYDSLKAEWEFWRGTAWLK